MGVRLGIICRPGDGGVTGNFYVFDHDIPRVRVVAGVGKDGLAVCSCVQYKASRQCPHTTAAMASWTTMATHPYAAIMTWGDALTNGPWVVSEKARLCKAKLKSPESFLPVFYETLRQSPASSRLSDLLSLFYEDAASDEGENLLRDEFVAFLDKLSVNDKPIVSSVGSDPAASHSGFDVSDKPKDFIVSDVVWRQLSYGVSQGENILLIGPSGSGKSSIAYKLAEAKKLQLHAFNMGAMSEPRLSLIGNTNFSKDKGTWFSESRFVKAVKNGPSIILLDELSRAERGAFNILLPLLDQQGYLPLDESDDSPIIHKGDQVSFVSTANIGAEYTGTDTLDIALQERFSIIVRMSFPTESEEAGLLASMFPKLSSKDIVKITKIAASQRKLVDSADAEMTRYISTRMLINTAKQLANGIPLQDAYHFCILNHFSPLGGEASDRAKLQQFFSKHI